MSTFVQVPISSLVIPSEEDALRPAPKETDKDYDKFLEMKESIAADGLLNSFSVTQDGEEYITRDGSRRTTALQQLLAEGRLPEKYFPGGMVTVQLRDGDNYDAMADMIRGNYHAKKTMTTQEIRQINKIALGKGWPLDKVAEYIGLSPQYVRRLFKLLELPIEVQEAIDSGKLSLINAHMLNKLPADLMVENLESAISKPADEFSNIVQQELAEWKKQKQGETTHKDEFSPAVKYAKKDEAMSLYEAAKANNEIEPNDYNRGCVDTLERLLGLDSATVEAARQEYEKKQREREEKKEQRKKEREQKKIDEARTLLMEKGIIND